jgi:hypothetical protein
MIEVWCAEVAEASSVMIGDLFGEVVNSAVVAFVEDSSPVLGMGRRMAWPRSLRALSLLVLGEGRASKLRMRMERARKKVHWG